MKYNKHIKPTYPLANHLSLKMLLIAYSLNNIPEILKAIFPSSKMLETITTSKFKMILHLPIKRKNLCKL